MLAVISTEAKGPVVLPGVQCVVVSWWRHEENTKSNTYNVHVQHIIPQLYTAAAGNNTCITVFLVCVCVHVCVCVCACMCVCVCMCVRVIQVHRCFVCTCV